jgi:integrase
MRNTPVLIRTVPAPVLMPTRHPNAELRPREHLVPEEVTRLLKAAEARGRYGHRDKTLLLLMYRHGLRVGEVTRLRWEHVHLDDRKLLIIRLKRGKDSLQELLRDEVRALRRLQRQWPGSVYVFMGERDDPLSPDAVRKTGLPHETEDIVREGTAGVRMRRTLSWP